MRNLMILLILFPFFVACNSDDDEVTEDETVSILGSWLLIAGRASSDTDPFPPEDTPFVEIESTNTITFFPDNTIASNARSLCSNTQLTGNPTSGVYTLVDSTYKSDDCLDPDYKYSFVQTDSIIIISYPYPGISEGKFKKIAELE